MLKLNEIYNMNCLDGMKELADNSIDLTVTSPPYDDLREYNDGIAATWNESVWKPIIKEIVRVTKKGGVVVWVVNDATNNGSESGTSFRQALHFMSLGMNLHDTMIFKKKNYMPLNHNRYDPEFEYMFVFSKGKPATFNPLTVRCQTFGTSRNYDSQTRGTRNEKKASVRARDENMETKEFRYRGNIWTYGVGSNKGTKDNVWAHPATFPEMLAYDHIVSWSNEREVVLDPFMGSGTVAKEALRSNRQFIGFELSAEYTELARKRIEMEKAQVKLWDIMADNEQPTEEMETFYDDDNDDDESL